MTRANPRSRRDTVLMLDARNVHRKMTRTVYEFAPEQLANLTAVVWLYRGEKKRFKHLIAQNEKRCRALRDALQSAGAALDDALPPLREALRAAAKNAEAGAAKDALQESVDALGPAIDGAFAPAHRAVCEAIDAGDFTKKPEALPALAALCRKLRPPLQETRRALDAAQKAIFKVEPKKKDAGRETFERAGAALDRLGEAAAENDRLTRHFVWLRDRFPAGEYRDVEGLCKAVARAGIEENDWSLTPGRYVGVAPEEDDPDFDFAARMTEIHAELATLNAEAGKLARLIQGNWADVQK